MIGSINGSRDVDDNEDCNVLCNLFSEHSYDAARDRVGAVGEVIRVQQIELDNNKTQNTADQLTHALKKTHCPFKC